MATIIDSLIVRLGLDSSEFESKKAKVNQSLKGTGKEADNAGGKLKRAGTDGAEGFSKAAKSAAAFFALIGGTMAIKRFIEQTIESSSALDRLSKNLGQSASTVSAWSRAAELAGGSSEGLQGTMDMLSKSQTELMLTGESGLIPYFSALGMSLADTQGKARPVNDLLLELSDRFSRMDRTTANNMGRMMGIDQGTMQLLLKGRSEVELMIARQKEYGAVTKKQAEESSRFREQLLRVKQGFEAFGRELLSAAMPALEKMFALFNDFVQWTRDNSEFLQAFLSILAAGLLAIGAAVMPINLTVAAVLALATAIALLWQDYQTWKRGSDSLIDWSKWEPGIKAAKQGLGWIKDLLQDMIYRAIAAVDILDALFHRDWDRAKHAFGEWISGYGKKYGNNEDESESQPKSAAPTTPPSPGTVNAKAKPGGSKSSQAAIAYFMAQGWTREQAAGITANIQRESAFDPSAVGDKGQAYGLAQWHPKRQADFKAQFGKDIRGSSFEDQLAFIQYEMTLGDEREAGRRLRAATSAADAAAIVSKHYERPADREGEASRRGQLAMSMLGGIPGAAQAAAGAGAASSVGTTNNASTQTSHLHIGEIKVYTAATDAQGIAQGIGGALRSKDYIFTGQSITGLN